MADPKPHEEPKIDPDPDPDSDLTPADRPGPDSSRPQEQRNKPKKPVDKSH